MNRQTKELIKSATAAKDAAYAAKSASDTAASQLTEMAKQTPALTDAANAAKSSAATSESALVDVQRPFLLLSIADAKVLPPDGAYVDTVEGFLQNVEISIENVGNQIAIIELAIFRLQADKHSVPYGLPSDLIRMYKNRGIGMLPSAAGPCVTADKPRIVRPEKTVTLSCVTRIDGTDIQRYRINDVRITLYGVIIYKDPLGTRREAGVTWMWTNDLTSPDHGFSRRQSSYSDAGPNSDYDYDRRIPRDPHGTSPAP
jgi:hypothetical protein